MMALSSANTKYTAEQLIRSTGISSETLATWGLTQATDTLTASQLAELASSDAQAKTVLEKIVAQNAQAVANGEVTATNIALATSEEGATLATGAFTTAIKANIAAIKTWLLTTPAGWLTILVGGIFTAVKLYDLFTISVEEANEKIDESRSAYEETTSTIESMNSELETTKKRIEELEAKDTLSFTDKAELDNLREQNAELERSISLLEKKRQNEAKQTVVDIKQNQETLDEDFDKSIKNLSEYKKEYEETRQLGIKGMAQGAVALENYEATMAAMDKTMGQYESSVLDNIEKYEQYKEDIINKYGTNDISTFSQSDRTLYNDIVSRLQAAYKEIYTDSEYNKFVIEPIFDEEKLKGIQDELLKYFINGGQTDLSSLEEKFGSDIITALRNACAKAGIDFDKMIQDMYDNSQSKLNQIAPLVDKPSGDYDAKQNQISKQIRDYIQNDLSDEDRTILLNATIPNDVKIKTKQDVDNFIASLREDINTSDETISLDSAKESVTGLSEEYTLLQEILKDTANVSEETYTKLLACSSKYSAAIRTENGRITLNTTKLKQVAKQRQLDTKATIKETLALKKQEWLQWRNKMSIFNGELLTSIEEKYDDIGALEAEITQYELLMNTIDQCANAFERFKAAQQTEDQDMYNTAQDAFNVLKEYSSDSKSENYGKFNRDEFQEAALLLMDNETYRKALNAKDLEEYTGIVNDFVKEVTPLFDENNAKSASNLFDQINKILESGDVPEADVDWAERLGISQEMFHALEQLANQYDFNNKEIFESFQLNKLDDYEEKTRAVADAEAALAAETDKTSNSYLYYSNVLQEAKQKRAQLVNETVSDTKESFDNWNSQTGGKSSFGEYIKAQLDYDETDIAGVAMMIQEKMQSISDNIAKMPSSVDTTSMQEQYQSLGDILTSLGYTYEEVDKQASALNQSSNNDEQISQYDRCVQLLQQRKKLEQDLAIMDVSSPEFTTTLNQLEGINTQIGLLKDPITIQLNADLDNVKSQLADIQKQKEEVQQSIQVSGSSAGAGDFKKLDYLNMQEQDLQNQQSVIEQKLKIITEGDEEANSAINELSSANIDDKTFNISANDTNAISKIDEINSKKIDDKTFNISANVSMPTISFGGNKSTGENHAKGTVGNAFASGYNGLPKDEKGALRSEYGQKELTVYPNGQYEITDTPTMSDLPKGTVIFNEEQTKRILKGNTHADGTVGNAFLDGTGTKVNVPNFNDVTTNNPAIKNAGKQVEETIDETTEEVEEASEEIFDWIERRVKKLQRLYDRFINNAEKTFSTTFIAKFFKQASSNLNKQLATQSAAFDRYMQEANNSGLSDDYKKKVADGLIDIETITDENLSKQINDYQNWYDKAIESLTAFEETSEKKFNLPLEKAAQKIELFKNQIDLLDKKIDNTVGYKSKNKLVNDQTKQEKNTLSAYKQASKATQKNVKAQQKAMSKITNADYKADKKDVLNANLLKTTSKANQKAIKNATKGNKEIDLSKLKNVKKGSDLYKAISAYNTSLNTKNAVKKGKEIDVTKYKEGSKEYQAAVKLNDAIRANKQATLDLANAQEDYNSWLQEAAKMKFDNIADFYSNQINLLDMSQKKIEDRISLLEAKGMSVNAKYYQGEIEYIKASKQQNEKKYAELSASLAKMEKDGLRGTDAWWEEVKALSAVNDAITQCDINIAEMNNKITETSETLINKVLDGVKSVSEEMEFMTGLMSKMDMFSEKSGAFTDEGLATMGGYASGANNSKYAQNYVDGLVKAFEQAKKDGKLEFNYDGQLFKYNSDEQRNNAELEWIKTLKDATQDYYDYTNKQIDMMIEKYQAELSALKEIVDCKKDALSATKDLHDYQKSITDSVKNAASLEKQIAALQGNNSEENMMKIQKLQKELDDANSDIAEKEYDRYISDQQNMLDKLYSEYETLINQKTKNRDKLLVEANTIAQATQDTIKKTFTEYGEKYNYTDYLGTIKAGLTTLTGNDSPLENIKKNVFDAVQSEGAIGKIPTAIGNVNTTLGGIAETINKILIACEKDPNANTGDGNTGGTPITTAPTGTVAEKVVNSASTLISKIQEVSENAKKEKDNTKNKALDYIKGSAGKPSRKKSEYSDVNKKIWNLTNGKVLSSSELKKLAKIIGVKYNDATKTGNLYKGLKSLGIKGFKRGGVISVDSLEKQIKANGDTTLLSGNPGERMLTAKQNDLFEKFVGELPQLNQLGNVIKPLVDMPKIPNVQPANRNMNNIVNVDNITLPNVKNYDEFKTQMFRDMQTDRKFENMIENMSIDKLDKNYNSLKKLKHRF